MAGKKDREIMRDWEEKNRPCENNVYVYLQHPDAIEIIKADRQTKRTKNKMIKKQSEAETKKHETTKHKSAKLLLQ